MTTNTTTNDTTKTQQRAVCPACFATQALTKSGALVAHGYKRPQHWHSNVGTCAGAGHQHFGTERGRDFTKDAAQRLHNSAAQTSVDAVNVLQGNAPVMGRKRMHSVWVPVVIENPTPAQRTQYAATLRQQGEMMRSHARELEALVAAWKPVAPIVVTVEAKKAPLLHFRTPRGKFCASSAMAAHTGAATVQRELVTCEKCKRLLERHDARVAAAATK